MAANKGGKGSKLRRCSRHNVSRQGQAVRTAKNKHNEAARRARRKAYWSTPEGQARKKEKEIARALKVKLKPGKPGNILGPVDGPIEAIKAALLKTWVRDEQHVRAQAQL